MFYIIMFVLWVDMVMNNKRKYLYNDVFICQVDEGSILLGSFMSNDRERRQLQLRNSFPQNWAIGKSMGHFLNYWFMGKSPVLVNVAIPGLGCLHSIRNRGEQAMSNKVVSITSPWPLHQFLLLGSYPVFLVINCYIVTQNCE